MKSVISFISLVAVINYKIFSQTSVVINTSKENEPISKYVYGQFIEHLGKSVYGGLWAEMILDRKFYFPIAENYDPWGVGQPDSWWGGSTFPYLKASPWKVIGATGPVSMDSVTPYTGMYAAKISLPGNGTEAGISHEAIALVKDKSYTGYIVLSGVQEALPITVRLVSKAGDTLSQAINTIDVSYAPVSLNFSSAFTTDSAKFEVVSSGSGSFRIGVLSLMPSDNADGWRADLIELLKQLDAPIYRWPGGNFVSGYDWRDGIGDRDKRAPRKNPAWTGIESNDVGIHEFMNLMKILNSEPFLALNMGLGSVEDAVAEVEYCNGDTITVEGKKRKANGQAEPFKVKYWAVGNEMYGNWQLGVMPLKDYEVKHNQAAQGIWEVDSTAQLVAVGDASSSWSSSMLTVCGDYMNFISEHKYCKEGANVVAHVNAIANPNPMAYNEPGKEPNIEILEEMVSTKVDSINVPAFGIVIVKFPVTIVPVKVESLLNKSFNLRQNYPNPFNKQTEIEFEIKNFSNVKLSIFDITGREIANLLNDNMQPGVYKESWNASQIADGIYYCKLIVDNFSQTNKMVLLK